jgi:hypothetical protein
VVLIQIRNEAGMENEADPILPITLPTPGSRDCTDYSSEVKLSIKVIYVLHV